MIVFVSNYYTHHQSSFSEAMYRLTNGEFYFISTEPMTEERLNMGWKIENASFVMDYDSQKEKCQQLIDSADVVIFGSAPESLFQTRLTAGMLTFKYSERVYKKISELCTFPARIPRYYRKWGRFKNFYVLCASAYASSDYALTGTFIGKAYKWGYFPEVKEYDTEKLFAGKRESNTVSLLWAGRLIGWKHPEVAVNLADKLKKSGYSFKLNIIGNGELEQELKNMIAKLGLNDCVCMLGSMTPGQVREHMEKSDIYLATSDRNEGWGAVLNESMNSCCAVVANRKIGSAPYLIEHEKNGFIYKDMKDLLKYVTMLVEAPELRCRLGLAAYNTMIKTWNAEVASERLIRLADELKKNKRCDIYEEGPCSLA